MSLPERGFCRIARAAATLLLLLTGTGTFQALEAQRFREEPSPRIESLRFVGAEALERDELRAAIVTDETRCRGGFLLRPLCWITDWSAVVQHEFLDPDEVLRDELRLEVFYFRRGYRDARVSSEVQPEGEGVEVVFNIEEGPPTLVGALRVEQAEELLTEGQLRRAGLPQVGEPLSLDRLDAAVAGLLALLEERGYLDAEVRDSVSVAPGEELALVEVVVLPGPRATLAALNIEGNERVDDRTIAAAIRTGPQRVLRSGDLLASQRSLYESNLFHVARIELPPQLDSAKVLDVTVREAPPRSARIGGGFSTVDFVQLEGRLTHFNFLGCGRRLEVTGTVGNLFAEELNGSGIFRDVLPPGLTEEEGQSFLRPTWRAGAELMQPGFLSAANRLGVGVFAQRRSVPGIVIESGFGFNTSVTRRLDYTTPLTLEYRYERTAVEAGGLYFCATFGVCDFLSIAALQGRHSLSPLGLAFFRDESDDPLSPRTGYRARLEFEHASGLTASDYRYNRAVAEYTRYVPLDVLRRRVLSGRVRAGWVGALEGTAEALGLEADGLALLHPRRRFFAGGSRSVRGFGENQLGPRVLTADPAQLTEEGRCTPGQVADGSCDPTLAPIDAFTPRPLGGSAVLEGSIEYRFPLWGLEGATFVDAAVVRGQLAGLQIAGIGALTPGFGIRYRTPVVPIRVDLGIRPTLAETLPVLTEFEDALGVRRLVLLDQPRRYDPVGEAGGGLWRQVTSRLRLHVSIGEAW